MKRAMAIEKTNLIIQMNRGIDRRSIRLKGYDYSKAGAYFVTVCTHNRKCLFGDIVDGKMVFNAAGHAAAQCWHAIPDHFPNALLDAFVVMPNHVHGIVVIPMIVGARHAVPLQGNNSAALLAGRYRP
jgi:REP element-mobilizing transposase RayT